MVTEADKRRKFQSFPFTTFNLCWFHLLETINGACCGMIQITQIYPLLELSPGRIACIRKCKQHHRIACIRKLSAREGFCCHIFLCRVCMLSAKITGAAAMKATGLRLWCYCLTIKHTLKHLLHHLWEAPPFFIPHAFTYSLGCDSMQVVC